MNYVNNFNHTVTKFTADYGAQVFVPMHSLLSPAVFNDHLMYNYQAYNDALPSATKDDLYIRAIDRTIYSRGLA